MINDIIKRWCEQSTWNSRPNLGRGKRSSGGSSEPRDLQRQPLVHILPVANPSGELNRLRSVQFDVEWGVLGGRFGSHRATTSRLAASRSFPDSLCGSTRWQDHWIHHEATNVRARAQHFRRALRRRAVVDCPWGLSCYVFVLLQVHTTGCRVEWD